MYLAQTACAQLGKPQPELLDGEFRVAVAFQHQIAVQHAVLQFAIQPCLGFPGVGRAEQFQSRIGGEQLHGGSRIHRLPGIPTDERLARVHPAHLDGDTVERDAGLLQRLPDCGRQRRGVGIDRKEQRGNKDEFHASASTIFSVRVTSISISSSVMT